MNNRKIKFRIWDNQENKFLEDPRINIAFLKCSPGEMSFASFGKIIQQSTGLKDDNGIEIYEGDIVKSDALWDEDEGENDKYYYDVIEWGNGGFCIDGDNFMVVKDDVLLGYEVAGNIFDNPELFNKV